MKTRILFALATTYEDFAFNRRGSAAIKPGKNAIAIHCRNTGGE